MASEGVEKVLEKLPEILKKQPSLKGRIYSILSENYVTRDEFYQHMKESGERFDRMLNEIKEMREESNKRWEKNDEQFKDMRERFEDMKDWVGITVGHFQVRAGRHLEDAIAGTLRIVLKRRDLKAENIVMRKKIRDEEGMIGRRGEEYEIDMYISNSETLLFEIKSYGDREAVEHFNDKVEMAKKKLGYKKVEKVFITLEKREEVIDACKRLGIILG